MACTQQAIMKAVEVNTSVGMDITYTGTGGGTNFTVYPTQSLFPNILALAADLHKQVYAVTIDPSYREPLNIVLVNYNNGNDVNNYRFSLINSGLTSWYSTDYAPLGFTGTELGGAVNGQIEDFDGESFVHRTATNPPTDTFLPTHYSSDLSLWVPDSEKSFIGVTGVDGNLSGASFTERFHRDISWSFEHAYNTTENTVGATAIQSAVSFTSIIDGARKNVLSISTDNTYCKGVYFVDNMSVYRAQPLTFDTVTEALPTVWNTDGSTNGDFIFCSSSVPIINDASFNNSKLYYNIGCRLTTAVSPSWTWDIS